MGKGTDEMNDNDTKAREIEDSIHRTEAQMADTITTIQHRLSPQHLKEEAMTRIRDTASKGMEKFQGTVKSNPVPFAAAAAGLTFLFIRRRKKKKQAAAGEQVSATMSPMASPQAAGPEPGEPGMRPPEMGITNPAVPSVMTGDVGQTAKGKVASMASERPIMLGAAGLAVGAILGALLPFSRKEREFLTQARESLLTSAREAGRSTMQRVQEMATGSTQARAQAGPEYK